MSKISLYDISEMYLEAIFRAVGVDENGKEYIKDEEMYKFLDEIVDERNEKVLNIACLAKDFKAEAEAHKEEYRKQQEKARVAENKYNRLIDYIKRHVGPGEKFKDSRSTISWRKSVSVSVECNPDSLPIEYQKIKIDPDKMGIKKALQTGEEINGCSLVENQNIQIK